ncbi:AAA-ATPase At3g50940-like isoform X2 [Amaranthus tricolor]|uniref:AAA-ATPase At3g50940-like isoform X2 n=1 Tax=Amaranthus tricolor TaxID=29722 RepID=UPI002582E382|nr:AAA-ATPase At3g50940-like isoform X2 [Amaranthus tricolor]
MAVSSKNMAAAKSVLSTLGSVAATAVVVRTVVNDFLPHQIRDYIFSSLHSFTRTFSSEISMIIEEFDGLETNQIFEAAELYIGARNKTISTSSTSSSATRLKVRKPESEKQIQVSVDRDEEIADVFEGVKFRWVLQCRIIESKNYYNPRDMNSTLRSEIRSFCLTFHKKFKEIALEKYLPHILKEAEFLKQEMKTIKLFTVDPNNLYSGPAHVWTSISLNHPATFETLAIDPELKKMIIEDLGRFVKRKEYYERVGKAWKRGYLLYGPPGTGKSSLIAAMANYLNFDIYDLELNGLRLDSELRKALVGTANKSIVVVEDIDCSIELNDRNNGEGVGVGPPLGFHEEKVTLSGLLNFIDGLWSSCGNERIIIFTTNHKEKLDPALLRPGRMDVHIHMSYCTPSAFKILAINYLCITHHKLFAQIDPLIDEAEVTPAEVAEQLMKHDDPDSALEGLIEFLKLKKFQNDEAKAKKLEEAKAKKLEDETKSSSKDQNDDENNAARIQMAEAMRMRAFNARRFRRGRRVRCIRAF